MTTKTKEPFEFNLNKLVESMLYLLSRGKIIPNTIPTIPKTKLLTMIYWADRSHLLQYGSPITGDSVKAFKSGPLPYFAFELFSYLRTGEGSLWNQEFKDAASLNFGLADEDVSVYGKRKPNLDWLSACAREELEKAYSYLIDKDQGDINKEARTHSGYIAAENSPIMSDDISFWEIIKDASDYKELKEYLEESNGIYGETK